MIECFLDANDENNQDSDKITRDETVLTSEDLNLSQNFWSMINVIISCLFRYIFSYFKLGA